MPMRKFYSITQSIKKTNKPVFSILEKTFIGTLFIAFFFSGNHVFSQANSIRTGVTFNWTDTQTNVSESATLEYIDIDGAEYNTFVVPSSYELTRIGPLGHDGNNIQLNGVEILSNSNDINWDSKALDAYQDLNLNHYFESDGNGDDFCKDYSAIATNISQLQTINYSPGIPSNPDGIIAMTERGGNNCLYVELWGTPSGGGTEQLLGKTFVRNQDNLTGVKPQAEPLNNSDYWSSGRNNDNNQIIGIALYKLSDFAPIGSIITSIKYYAASTDNGDGKFFLMQTYAVDDIFDTGFETILNGDVALNDNTPLNSTYTVNTAPSNGSVTVNTNGTFSYTPNPSFIGVDTFSTLVCLPAPNQAVCNISTISITVNNPNPPLLSINNASAQEGDNIIFTITNSGPINQPIVIDLGYTNTTTTFSDYNGPTSVTLPANASSISFNVTTIDDIIIEADEKFEITLSSTNSVVGFTDDTGDGIINDSNTDFPDDETVSCDTVPAIPTIVLNAKDCAYTVDFTENTTGQNDACPSEYTITRNWIVTDCVGNVRTHTQTITVEDTVAPTFVETLPQDMTVECTAVPDADSLTVNDNCDSNAIVTFTETATNNRNCSTGYIITRTWVATDCAGNNTTHTQTITINPTAPITASDYNKEVTISCGDEFPEVPALEFTGGCGDYTVVFTEEEQFSASTDDYIIVRTWNVTDSCDNTEIFEQIIFVMQPEKELITIDICIEDPEIDLLNYLPANFDTNGTFEITSGNATLNGSYFNPINFEIGEYLISYSATDTSCKFYADLTININADCLPCNVDDIIVSKAVTVNGDGKNDFFTITGLESCGFEYHVMLFNRWGDKVFESEKYENDWGGTAPNGSFGSSGVLPAGTYYYIINVANKEAKPLNGYIYLGTE